MTTFVVPLLFTVFVWWFSTGVILYLDGRPPSTFKWTFAGASVLGVLGLAGIAASAADTTVASAYCSFTCALLVWAWQEVAFLLGYVTGPRRVVCDAQVSGWRRAAAAWQTIAHHECALLVLAILVLAVTWNMPNQTAWWTFAVLWAMRQSAKLNVFLGVRNLGENFLPAHLQYLKSYFVRKRMNPLLPVSVVGSGLIVVPIWQAATRSTATGFECTAYGLVGSLLSLAILEHLLLVLPLPTEPLWRWGLQSHRSGERVSDATTPVERISL